MTSEAKRLLEQALSSPEFMAEVKAAVLASPLVKAKNEEIARLRAEVERLNDAIRDAVSVFDPSGPEPVTTGLLAFMQRNVKRDLDAALARAESLQRHADGQAEVIKAVAARAEAAEARVKVLHAMIAHIEDAEPDGIAIVARAAQAESPAAPVESAPGAEWTCSRCGYSNLYSICTKCGNLPAPAPPPAEPPAPAAEPGTCPHHKMKWIEGTTCPKCGGRRFWHSGMGETTTDEHQKCIGPCGMDRFVDGIDS